MVFRALGLVQQNLTLITAHCQMNPIFFEIFHFSFANFVIVEMYMFWLKTPKRVNFVSIGLLVCLYSENSRKIERHHSCTNIGCEFCFRCLFALTFLTCFCYITIVRPWSFVVHCQILLPVLDSLCVSHDFNFCFCYFINCLKFYFLSWTRFVFLMILISFFVILINCLRVFCDQLL